MILIANREEDLFAPLDERVHSRLSSSARIRFGSYSVDELVAILRDRVRWGLDSDAITDDGLEFIADAAAGDARTSIGILRTAARKARKDGLDNISVDLIEAAVPEARSEIRQKSLDKLTDHQRALFEIIDDEDEIRPSPLYEQYQDRVADPKTKRTMRNYLQKMEQYNLIVTRGNTKARSYRPVNA